MILKVGLPLFVAIQVKTRKRAALVVNDHSLTIGHRRRVAAAAIAMLALPLRAKLPAPSLLAVHVVTDNAILALDSARDEDPLSPDGRRRSAEAGQIRFPGNAFRIGKLTRIVAALRHDGT